MIEIIALIAGAIVLYLLKKNFVYGAMQHGAPYMSTSVETLEEAINMLEIKPGQVFYELGSGDGRAVIYAAMKGAKAYGVEINWFRATYSRIWIFLLRLQSHAKIIQTSFFDVDLKEADIVFMYLLPVTIKKLEAKFKQELKPGSTVISIGFPFANWHPIKANEVIGPIYIYKM